MLPKVRTNSSGGDLYDLATLVETAFETNSMRHHGFGTLRAINYVRSRKLPVGTSGVPPGFRLSFLGYCHGFLLPLPVVLPGSMFVQCLHLI